MDEDRSAFNILTGIPTGKRLLEMHKFRWDDYIIKDLKGIYIDTRNGVDSGQDRVL